MSIIYATDRLGKFRLEVNPVNAKLGYMVLRPGQNQHGYGNKISTDYMVRFADNRPRRVYAICWSNVASYYVTVRGERLYFRDYELQEKIDSVAT